MFLIGRNLPWSKSIGHHSSPGIVLAIPIYSRSYLQMKSFLKEESFLVQDDAAAKHYVSSIFDAILL